MMHAKQHQGFAPRGVALMLFLLGSSGCAMLAKIGIGDDRAEPGSKIPDRDPVTSQREGGAGEPPSSPKTCYGDTTADTHNCGFCGHDCGAAACEGGLCAPTKVTSAKDVRAVAVEDDSRVFFTTEHEIRSCTLGKTIACASLLDVGLLAGLESGGSSEGYNGDGPPGKGQTASSGNSLPSALDVKALALYGDRFFAADQGNDLIVSCPKAGCSATSIAAVKPRFKAAFAGGLGVDSTLVVWGDVNGVGFGDLPGPTRVNSGDLIHYPLAHTVSRIEMIRTGTPIEDLIYRGTDGVFSLGSSLGATPKEIMAGSNIQDFAFDAASVYLAIKDGVVRFDRATRKLSPMVDLAGWEVVHLVADAQGVYASIKSPLAEKLVRLREAFADTLAVGSQLGTIGLSKTWIYYATDAEIFRVAR